MPSGFQQDQNQLTPSYYRVVITMTGGATAWYPVNDSEGPETEGRISTYAWDNFEGDSRPTTLRKAQALSRGNMRFQNIVTAVENLADCQILDIEEAAAANGDAMADNSNIAFTIKFDRDEGVFPAYCAIRKAEGASTNGNATVTYDNVVYPQYWTYSGQEYAIGSDASTTTADTIRDVIWKALNTSWTRSVRVFHPVEGSSPLVGEGVQEVLTANQPFDNGPNAFTDIAVNEINGTTTTISTD